MEHVTEYVFGALFATFIVLCMIYDKLKNIQRSMFGLDAWLGDLVKEVEVTNIKLSVLLTEIGRIQALKEDQYPLQGEQYSPADDSD
jgi:hypothetical protein